MVFQEIGRLMSMSDMNIISKTNQFGRVVTLTFREGLQHIEVFMNSEFGLGFSLGLDYSYKQNQFELEIRRGKETFRVYLSADLTLEPTRSLNSSETEVYKFFKDLWYRAWGMNLGFFR